eukprot:1341052-Pyramimonas_sp.AAC.2
MIDVRGLGVTRYSLLCSCSCRSLLPPLVCYSICLKTEGGAKTQGGAGGPPTPTTPPPPSHFGTPGPSHHGTSPIGGLLPRQDSRNVCNI